MHMHERIEDIILSMHIHDPIGDSVRVHAYTFADRRQCFCLRMTSYIYSTLLKNFIEELFSAEHKQKDAGSERDVAGQQAFDVIPDVILRLSDTQQHDVYMLGLCSKQPGSGGVLPRAQPWLPKV